MNIGESLKRKFGPLPAWAWLLLLLGVVYYYRKYVSGSSVSGTGTGSVTPTPPTPQPQTVLQPGQTVYDPNTGAFQTAPGGSTDTGTGAGLTPTGPDTGTAIEDLANVLAQAMNQQPQAQVPLPNVTTPPASRPRTGPVTPHGKHPPRGTHTKTKTRTAKGKPGTKLHKIKGSLRPRSGAGKQGPRLGASFKMTGAASRPRGKAAPPKPAARQRITHPAVSGQHPTQHRTTAPPPRPVHPAPRPSAPPPRQQRRPAPKRGKR